MHCAACSPVQCGRRATPPRRLTTRLASSRPPSPHRAASRARPAAFTQPSPAPRRATDPSGGPGPTRALRLGPSRGGARTLTLGHCTPLGARSARCTGCAPGCYANGWLRWLRSAKTSRRGHHRHRDRPGSFHPASGPAGSAPRARRMPPCFRLADLRVGAAEPRPSPRPGRHDRRDATPPDGGRPGRRPPGATATLVPRPARRRPLGEHVRGAWTPTGNTVLEARRPRARMQRPVRHPSRWHAERQCARKPLALRQPAATPRPPPACASPRTPT